MNVSSQNAEDKVRIMEGLDRLVDAIEGAIQIGRIPTLTLSNASEISTFNSCFRRIVKSPLHSKKVYCFGSRTFEVLLAVISYVYEALNCSISITKRDIYYRDVLLFKSQVVVDNALQRLTMHLGVQRHQLNVKAAAKGLLRGNLQLIMKNDSILNCLTMDVLIENVEEIQAISIGPCDIVLVVEKEAIYHSLVSCQFHNSNEFSCILITGKGYPDVATRQFLCLLEKRLRTSKNPIERTIPMLCLVDFDPHGIEILSIYKYGSQSMALDNEHLAVADMKWLGMHSGDFSDNDPTLIPFSVHDTKKLDDISGRACFHEFCDYAGWRHEISAMEVRQRKAEIEILSDRKGGLVQHIKQKVMSRMWL